VPDSTDLAVIGAPPGHVQMFWGARDPQLVTAPTKKFFVQSFSGSQVIVF
jgi:hypothetical protein